MPDATATPTGSAEPVVEFRPCSFCGEAIHPSSHRCFHCGGHVGLGWGTVHKELFLFLFLSITMAVACFASWTGRTPVASAESVAKAIDAAQAEAEAKWQEMIRAAPPGSPAPARPEVSIDEKSLQYDTVGPAGRLINGLDTLRGALILALAAYGIFV